MWSARTRVRTRRATCGKSSPSTEAIGRRRRTPAPTGLQRFPMTDTVCAVVVTHQRPDELAKSLDAVSAQTRAPDHLVVVDNDDDARVRDVVNGQPIATTYVGSRLN